MMCTKYAAMLIALSVLGVSNLAFAAWTCPDQSKPITVDGTGYDNYYYQPRIHFSSQAANDWSYLSYHQGVNKDYGKAMLAIALTANATRGHVKVRCSSTSIDGLWITEGTTSPN